MNIKSLEYIYSFYNKQPSQIQKIQSIQEWFEKIENEKTKPIIILGNTGIGKSNIVEIFCNNTKLDVIHIGKLFEVYENNNSYSTKDFIPKILKQKNVSQCENINKQKLLVIDSLEEFFVIQKGVIREIVDQIENLHMPIVIVADRQCFEDLEKKVLTKLKKCCLMVELEKPSEATIQNYLVNRRKMKIKAEDIGKMIHYSKGDLRYINTMLEFQWIGQKAQCNKKETNRFVKNIGENQKDLEIEVESVMKEIGDKKITDSFHQCETDPFIFGMLTYENYIGLNHRYEDKKRNYIIEQICYADLIEKNLFRYQQWELLDIYAFFSTIYPWKLLENPKVIQPSTTLQKFLNTKKRNKKYDLLF